MMQSDPGGEGGAEFITEITRHQGDLWAFLCSLMPGHPDVPDVLQKTNIVLWNKRAQFTPGTNFRAWAFKIARYEMLHHLRSRRRDNWVPLKPELCDLIEKEFPEKIEPGQDRLVALESCLSALRPQDRQLVEHRYRKGSSLDDFARKAGRSVSSLSVTLHRLRAALRDCVEQKLARP